MKWYHCHYDPINDFVDDERESDVDLRYYDLYMYVVMCFTVNVLPLPGIVGKHISSTYTYITDFEDYSMYNFHL